MDEVKITFIGHSTTLIEGGGNALLTDPIFSGNVLFVKRAGELAYDPSKLPDLKAVIVSHTHIDHLDFASFNYIKTDVPIIVPEGSNKTVSKRLPNPVIELGGWADHILGEGLKVHAVPINHPSGILHPHRFKQASGYIIEFGEKIIFFAGDTTYNMHFRDIGNTYSIDAALLPIGSYKPAFYMKHFHMDPTEAVQAFLDLKSKIMIPIHWGTFRLSLEKLDEPVEWLKKVAAEREIEGQVKILEPGGSLVL